MSAPSTPPPRNPGLKRDFRFRSTGIPCEWAESYHPGGFHPVHFGDVLNGRYEVICKLGNGSFATVWLALDSVCVYPSWQSRTKLTVPRYIISVHRYVALKIEVAKLQDAKQLSIHRNLVTKAPDDLDSRFIVTLLDSFVHEGPNGRHLCLVLEPMGPSVSSILNAPQLEYDPRNPQPRRFPKKQARDILRNVLIGLRFLHSNGIVHGDLQSGNMLFAIQDLRSVSIDQLRQDVANSRIEALERVDGKVDKWAPKYLVVPEPLNDYVLQGPDQVVKIIDMGGAFFESDPPRAVVTPAALRAPEAILGCPAGRGIDIWSFGCLVFEFLTGLPLFQLPPIYGSDESLDDSHLIQLTEVMQPLPEDLLSKWRRARRYYAPNGERLDAQPWELDESEGSQEDSAGFDAEDEGYDEFDELEEGEFTLEKQGPPKPHDSLEKLFRDNKPDEIREEEEKDIMSLMRWTLQYDPLKRPSAADLLEHPWLKA